MWMLFIGDLRRRWFEYSLGTVAVALVVAALVTQRAVTSSAEDAVHDLAHRLGRNMLVVPEGTDLAAFHDQRYGSEALPDSSLDALRSSAVAQHLRSIEARLYGNVKAGTGEVIVVGQDIDWPSLGDADPAVLGPAAARVLGVSAGGTFRLGDRTLSVLQVSDAPADGLDSAVFMPLAAAQRVLGRPGQLSALRLGGCWCRIDVATLAGEIEKILPGSRAITVAGMVNAQKGSVETMKRYATVLNLSGLAVIAVMGVLAALCLVIAAHLDASERRIELATLAAIGASRATLLGLLLSRSALVAAAGAIAGVIAGGALAAAQDPDVAGAIARSGSFALACVAAALGIGLASAVPTALAWALRDPVPELQEG